MSAARALAALRPEEFGPEPEPEPSPAPIVVHDLPPGATPVLHEPVAAGAAPASSPAAAEPLPEPGIYLLTLGDRIIPLVQYNTGSEGVVVHLVKSCEAAAQILRAFGGDPAWLSSVPDAAGQPDSA